MRGQALYTIILIFIIFTTSATADLTSTFVLPSGVDIKIIEAPFQRNLFQVEGCLEQNTICRINGHVPFGTAFGLPKTYIKSIIISFQERSYALDVSDMFDAWGNRPFEIRGVIRYFGGKCFDSKNCQFRGLFSDAAGAFVAEWRIVNGMSIRTVLTNSDDVVNLFMKNIEPPEFD